MGKRELIALLLSSWCLVMVERHFLTVPRGCLQFVIVVFPDHTHLLFLYEQVNSGLYYGNLDFNFNVDEEKTLLNLVQRYLNVHYLLKHVSRF